MEIAERIGAVDPDTCSGRCDPEIYKVGELVAVMAGERASRIEELVCILREQTGERVDWHYSGGRAQILTLGKREKVRSVLLDMLTELTDFSFQLLM